MDRYTPLIKEILMMIDEVLELNIDETYASERWITSKSETDFKHFLCEFFDYEDFEDLKEDEDFLKKAVADKLGKHLSDISGINIQCNGKLAGVAITIASAENSTTTIAFRWAIGREGVFSPNLGKIEQRLERKSITWADNI